MNNQTEKENRQLTLKVEDEKLSGDRCPEFPGGCVGCSAADECGRYPDGVQTTADRINQAPPQVELTTNEKAEQAAELAENRATRHKAAQDAAEKAELDGWAAGTEPNPKRRRGRGKKAAAVQEAAAQDAFAAKFSKLVGAMEIDWPQEAAQEAAQESAEEFSKRLSKLSGKNDQSDADNYRDYKRSFTPDALPQKPRDPAAAINAAVARELFKVAAAHVAFGQLDNVFTKTENFVSQFEKTIILFNELKDKLLEMELL